ncbi:brain-specific angiogenesis inhibitor 1-associated protein 2-like protein 2 [Megalops cyprinoides]|uniref:brain-specific angiogenesis inhibitor 1-associated protein 2-like protein 2 n=1 Tax=Megalops cyprinoides TaxID=118141 RepID=UPI001864F548|nr:brain-specific angiogenesis inhibitor 1-associated protein 2-like protein 2 [Megalops cyprinoides]
MSGPNSDQLHRSTLKIYSNLMEQFNPGLQKLVSLGNTYAKAFQALAVTSEAYFSALAKMGEQALHSVSSGSLGDVLIQISDSQRRLTAELGGLFQWFQAEVLQVMENNIKLDEDYIAGSRRHYEVEVRNQAAALERQLRRGAYRDTLESSEYMQYLRQSQREALVEEERRYRFLAEKHCGLTQTLFYLIKKTVTSLQQKADGWKERVNETRIPRARSPLLLDQDAALRSSVASLLQTGEEDRERGWTSRDHQPLGKVPSRAPSPLPSRSRSSSVGESLGMGGGKQMRALVTHPASSNPTLLPFSRDEIVTVMVQEPRNGWLYGWTESNMRQGWFPAAYVGPLEDTPKSWSSDATPRRHSANNVLEQTDRRSYNEGKSYNEIPAPAPASRRGSTDLRPVTPTPDRRAESSTESKSAASQQGGRPELFPRGTNPFATVKLRPTVTNDRSAPRIH